MVLSMHTSQLNETARKLYDFISCCRRQMELQLRFMHTSEKRNFLISLKFKVTLPVRISDDSL